jgi:DNA-binding winged helix-turn-helix (wHTH) protein
MGGTFFFGEWQIEPSANTVQRGKQLIQLEPKAMDVLLLLCKHPGEVLSADDIVRHCWPDAEVGDNPLHKMINQIRRALGDSATEPSYIETIRKRGYRTLAEVRFPLGHEESVATQSWQGGSPFPGLQAYDASYASVFFGRSEQINSLLDGISQQIKYGRAFCLVLGPSGSGKSSLINAGVMPNLMKSSGYNGVKVESYSSLDLADVAQHQLMTDLAGTLLDWELNEVPVFAGHSAQTLAQLLSQDMAQVLQCCKTALSGQAGLKSRFALFIDRLEVLLSSPMFSPEQRSLFIDCIEQLACSDAVLVLSACRNEFYPLLVTYPSLMAGKARGAHFDLAPPGRAELLQMIRLPAIAANLSWQQDPDTAVPLDELLCSEAASNPDALPMLQYTLQALYLQRSPQDQLLVSVYKQLGGIEGAIGKNAEQAVAALSDPEKASVPKVLSLLVTLREDEQSVTSRTARWAQLQNEAERTLVQAMVEHRLFVSHLQNNEPCFSIAHEALLRRWPRATAWIAEHHEGLSNKSRLHHLTRRWLAEGKNPAYLLAQGKPLQQAQQLAANQLFSLDLSEVEFIQASTKRALLVKRSKRLTFALLCMLTFVAVLMSYRSFEAEKLAQQKRLAAENLLGFMVGEFADKLRSIGRMDLLDGISNKALEYFSGSAEANSNTYLSTAARLQHGQTLEAMGEVAYSRGKTDEAKAALLAAREKLLPVLAERPDNLELLKTLGANAFWLGQLHYDAKNWAEALPYLQQYQEYSSRMYQLAPDNLDALMELSFAINSLGSVAMKQQNFELAVAYFQQSLELKLKAQLLSPENSALVGDIADTRSWLASAAAARGDLDTAVAVHQKIQQEFKNGTQKVTLDPYLVERLYSSYEFLALVASYRGFDKEAFELAYTAYQLTDKNLEQDPENKVWQRDVFKLKLILFRINQKLHDPRFNETLAELEDWLKASNLEASKHYMSIRARLWLESARYYQGKKMYQYALEVLQRSNEQFEQLVVKNETDFTSVQFLTEGLLLQASIQQSLGEPNYSEKCRQAQALLESVIAVNKSPQFVAPYVRALSCTGNLDSTHSIVIVSKQQGITNLEF